ncbi:RNA polymerase sigma factor [Rhodobacteraceae bacterium B1Z28]|uniref:RNA polymerase sigma factor n=1 Tax=Ruegeria haliotis TaxID=2747601 RepID=A0ABX2PUA2_9RHOB|nr:RNA polymerase sigma factor [Ruegeria haliotis]NVO57758.1 RNA polymerase sigma factor [Ruegeria haliotis]
MKTSDEDLAMAAANGDADAFATLLARHYDRVFRLAFRLTGQAERAEDLTQDICAALPTKIAGFRAQAKFTTWLYRVVVNAAEDARRRHVTHDRAAAGWGDFERMRRAEEAEAADAVDWLHRAMRDLPQELQDTLALTLDDELTHADAAEVLGISEGTVSWRMSEIRKRLRAMRQEELAQ